MIRDIASKTNENYKTWSQLSNSRGIKKFNSFFLMGDKLINEFLKDSNFQILAEIMGPDHESLLQDQRYDKIAKYRLSKELFNDIDVIGTHHNLLLLKLPEPSKAKLSKPSGLELVLPIGDPGNLGACIRSACAFGVKNIFLTSEASHPYHPKAIKASAGACLKVNFFSTSSLATAMTEVNTDLSYALDKGGTDITKFIFPKDMYLFVGEEGGGLAKHPLKKITISTKNIESLNAAVAVSLACFSHQNKK